MGVGLGVGRGVGEGVSVSVAVELDDSCQSFPIYLALCGLWGTARTAVHRPRKRAMLWILIFGS